MNGFDGSQRWQQRQSPASSALSAFGLSYDEATHSVVEFVTAVHVDNIRTLRFDKSFAVRVAEADGVVQEQKTLFEGRGTRRAIKRGDGYVIAGLSEDTPAPDPAFWGLNGALQVTGTALPASGSVERLGPMRLAVHVDGTLALSGELAGGLSSGDISVPNVGSVSGEYARYVLSVAAP